MSLHTLYFLIDLAAEGGLLDLDLPIKITPGQAKTKQLHNKRTQRTHCRAPLMLTVILKHKVLIYQYKVLIYQYNAA
jgi:hypothetical protein